MSDEQDHNDKNLYDQVGDAKAEATAAQRDLKESEAKLAEARKLAERERGVTEKVNSDWHYWKSNWSFYFVGGFILFLAIFGLWILPYFQNVNEYSRSQKAKHERISVDPVRAQIANGEYVTGSTDFSELRRDTYGYLDFSLRISGSQDESTRLTLRNVKLDRNVDLEILARRLRPVFTVACQAREPSRYKVADDPMHAMEFGTWHNGYEVHCLYSSDGRTFNTDLAYRLSGISGVNVTSARFD